MECDWAVFIFQLELLVWNSTFFSIGIVCVQNLKNVQRISHPYMLPYICCFDWIYWSYYSNAESKNISKL